MKIVILKKKKNGNENMCAGFALTNHQLLAEFGRLE